MATTTGERPRTQLRRELHIWGAIAFSIGAMGPTFAMSLNGVLPAGLVGRAVPLVFLLATIGIALVSYAFIKLAGYFASAGSVYAFAGATIGPRGGFVAGWALLGTYYTFTVSTIAGAALFCLAFLDGSGLWHGAPWFPFAVAFGLLIWWLAYNEVKIIARTILTIEFISIALISILVVDIFVRVIAGTAPGGQSFTLSVFSVPDGVSIGTVGLATVFGFLSFAGFESAAVLGEETNDPKRNIGRAILLAVLIGGAFYVVTMTAQSLGFGATTAGAKTFSESSAPLGDLARQYIGGGMSDLINLGAMVSSLGSALATSGGAARLMYSFSRDGLGPPSLATTSPRTGAPAVALAVLMLTILATLTALKVITSGGVIDVYFWMATIGVLSLLFAYIMTTIGAGVFLFIRQRVEPLWQAPIPALGVLFLGYALWKNIFPVPASPYNLFPYIVLAWLALALAIIVLKPDFTRRIGSHFADQARSAIAEPVRPPG